MINKNIKSIIVSLSIATSCASAFADELTWIAQDYPPYSYIEDNGNKAGLAIDIASGIMKKLGSNQNAQNIDVKVFSRFFIRMNDNQNTVFFPFAQAPDREKYFKWIGPIAMNQPVIIAKTKRHIVINNPTDLNQYSIGTKDGYSAVSVLKNLGINSSVFQIASSDEEDLKNLGTGVVDLVLCDELACKSTMKKLSMDKDYEIIYRMQPSKFSLAISKSNSDEMVNKINQAFDDMKISKHGNISEYDAIMKRYEVK
jgi:polar amino acid transport system substrate-binding protein